MTLTRRMDRNGLITTEVSGTVSTAAYLDGVLELGELTAYASDLWEIVIIHPETLVLDDKRASLELAHSAKETLQFKSRGAIALYCSTHRLRPWSEDIASLLRGDAVPVISFNDESDARKWLDISRKSARQTATTRVSVSLPGALGPSNRL